MARAEAKLIMKGRLVGGGRGGIVMKMITSIGGGSTSGKEMMLCNEATGWFDLMTIYE